MHSVTNTARIRTRLAAALWLLGLTASAPSLAAPIIIDTDQGTINGIAPGGTFRGTAFTIRTISGGGITEFVFQGDLNMSGDSIAFTGSRGASLFVGGNADLSGSSFDLSATGQSGTAGGGNGGGGTAGSVSLSRSLGGRGGSGGAGGAGGGLGGGNGERGGAGRWGESSTSSVSLYPTAWGNNGQAGLNNSGAGTGAPRIQAYSYYPVYAAPGAGGAGGAGGSGGLGNNGSHGNWGGDGASGTNGIDGRASSSPGGYATNSQTSFDLLSAGAGGGGGGGGTNGANGRGGAGGGGGGGGGGEEGNLVEDGDRGGIGALGGRGGDGGQGGDGGRGGDGGGGGGALQVFALGRVTAGGAVFDARGGDGSQGDRGIAGSPGAAGGGWRWGSDGGEGGNGGRSGIGGNGGDGGRGGDGTAGGAGAGGTIKIVGTTTNLIGANVNTLGGDGNAAASGRFLLGDNTGASTATIEQAAGQTEISGTGPRGINPFIRGGASTAYIPDLIGGADLFGLLRGIDATHADFDTVFGSAPEGARGALLRLDVGPAGHETDFAGFDMLLFLNLTPEALIAPMLGVDPAEEDSDFRQALLEGGIANNTMFGGSGPSAMAALSGFGIYATLVADNGTIFNASAGGALAISGAHLGVGEVAYLIAAVPEPGSVELLVLAATGVLLINTRRRHGSHRRSRTRRGNGVVRK